MKSPTFVKDQPDNVAERRRRAPTAIHALEIIEHLNRAENGRTLSDVAHITGLDMGQTRRMLAQLVAREWVSQEARGQRYAIGPRALGLAAATFKFHTLRTIAQPVLESLAAECGETALIAEPAGSELVCTAAALSPQALMVASRLGDRWPMSGTVVGTAFRGTIEAEVPPSKAAIRWNTFSDGRQYAVDRIVYKPGVAAIAAPIVDSTKEVLGALAISTPVDRMTSAREKVLARLILDAADTLAHLLGAKRRGRRNTR